MALDWILGLLLVCALAITAALMMGVGVVGALTEGRVARCSRCGRIGMGVRGRPVHGLGCPHPAPGPLRVHHGLRH